MPPASVREETESQAVVRGGTPRILVLVLSIDREPWRTIELEGQRRSWAAPDSVPGACSVVFYYGRRAGAPTMRVASRLSSVSARGPARSIASAARWLVDTTATRSAEAGATLIGDRLWTRVPEYYGLTLPKLLAALRWATAGEPGSFDYIYRTNTSSYVNLERLLVVAAELPRTSCYAGWTGPKGEPRPMFVRGAGVLLSWDLAREIAGQHTWEWNLADDAALGRFLGARGVVPIPITRVRLRSPEDVGRLSEERLRTTVHYRCKNIDRTDHLTMAAIHARIKNR